MYLSSFLSPLTFLPLSTYHANLSFSATMRLVDDKERGKGRRKLLKRLDPEMLPGDNNHPVTFLT